MQPRAMAEALRRLRGPMTSISLRFELVVTAGCQRMRLQISLVAALACASLLRLSRSCSFHGIESTQTA
jgi:hypothetical protein